MICGRARVPSTFKRQERRYMLHGEVKEVMGDDPNGDINGHSGGYIDT